MKVPPLKLQNKYELLYTSDNDSDNDTVDTGRSTPIVLRSSKGASPIKECGAKQKQACLIPRKINYFIVAHYVSRFISKLRGRIYPKRYFVRTIRPKSEIMVKVGLRTMDTHRLMDVNALLDSSATGMFMDKKFAEGNNISMRLLNRPIRVYNVDGTLNHGGSITHEATLMMSHKGHKEKATFEVCDLGKCPLIIGFTWLHKHNPDINWRAGNIEFTRCPSECNVAKAKKRRAKAFRYKASIEEDVDEDDDFDDYT